MKNLTQKFALGILTFLFAVCNVYPQTECDIQVSFDNQPLHIYGDAQGDNQGDIIFSEGGIDVRIDDMLWTNGSRGYNYVEIQEADCGMGHIQRAWFNNASLVFDLNTIYTSGVSFIFEDHGGDENLQVNGNTEYVTSSFQNLPVMLTPNIYCFVNMVYKDDCNGNDIGRVTLIGNINELRIAGQELAVDSICIDGIPQNELPDLECETQVSFDQQPPNTFGNSYGDAQGDIVFSEAGIDVRIDDMLWFGGSRGYNYVQIQEADCGVGHIQRAWFNNASLVFDLNAISTIGLSFIYQDHGGDENLQVNGATEHVVTGFDNLPTSVAPGVMCFVENVYKDNCNGHDVGKVTLIGDINELRIAGQELVVDSICIDETPEIEIPDLECETQVSFDQQPPNTFGNSYGDAQGDIVFSEAGIDVRIDDMLWFGGSRGYNYVQIQEADCGVGHIQRAWFNNASLVFDLNAISTIGLSFIYQDHGGDENLQVNGATEHVVTGFDNLPTSVAPGVMCFVENAYKDNCNGHDVGKVTLIGDINELRIAGQELVVDSICIDETPSTGLKNNRAYRNYHLSQNYPNPFSTSTNISYALQKPGFVSLKVYDVLGREVKVLVNEFQNSNQYKILFAPGLLPNGIYYYKLQVNNFVCVRKMLLIR